MTLQLGQTLYSGGQLASGYRRAVAQQEAARSGLLQTVVQVEQAVGNAWSNLIVSRAQIDATGRQIEAAQIAFDGLREEATLGARTTLDVLDAEQDTSGWASPPTIRPPTTTRSRTRRSIRLRGPRWTGS